jgi:D-glycero-alpha-D-manno-heptose-7-phosphate kinase
LSAAGGVRVAAPCRADLAGGTLDIWPLGLLHPGALTVNMALSAEVVLEADRAGERGVVEHVGPDGRRRLLGPKDAGSDLTATVVFALVPDGGFRVRVAAQVPVGSGLGGSSAYGIALTRAVGELVGSTLGDADAVALVRDLEARVLATPTGEQDHWAAVCGGVLAIHQRPGGSRVEPLEVEPGWLGDRSTVYFTGIRHHSGMVNWQVVRRRLDGEPDAVAHFEEIAAAAQACRQALVDGDEIAVAESLRREWAARRRLAPEVSPPEVERLVELATAAGATAVKACGAGGGGSLLLWHPPAAGDGVVAALDRVAPEGRVLARGASAQGCRLLGNP